MLNLDNEELSIKCPKCDTSIDFKVKQIGTSIICSNCKSEIHLEDDGFKKGLSDLDNTLKDLFK